MATTEDDSNLVEEYGIDEDCFEDEDVAVQVIGDTIDVRLCIQNYSELSTQMDMIYIKSGSNWEALVRYYMEKHDPEVLVDMTSDSDIELFAVRYPDTPENMSKANRIAELTRRLFKNKDEMRSLIKEANIDWKAGFENDLKNIVYAGSRSPQ
ncbi:MAG: immunity 51 family protein [Clostridiales bacterium]|jgi:hypothetical protein|nr:immunity 51 family protein [Clostridiales bacterium]